MRYIRLFCVLGGTGLSLAAAASAINLHSAFSKRDTTRSASVVSVVPGATAKSSMEAKTAVNATPGNVGLRTTSSSSNGFDPSTVIQHDIEVTTVDPSAVQQPNKRSGVPNKHFILVPADPVKRQKRLFVFVSGTGSTETQTQEIIRAGAERGYHSVAIAYSNYSAVAKLCLASLDAECTSKVREEILTGNDLSPLVEVGPHDGLETRLRNLLIYLQATYPNEGWDNFMSQGEVDWSKISAVGHSQGAGNVAYLAKRHSMFRAVMISGVFDITATALPAPWLSRPNVTPVDRQYGFSHVADYVVPIVYADASWNAIGLQAFGPLYLTDGQQPGYGGSHKLSTALVPASGANPHVSMLEDSSMPRNQDGSPAFKRVWDYMAFP
jgi:hypothetical protein